MRIGVGGMTCASCVARVEGAIARKPGVESTTVNPAAETAVMRFDQAQIPELLEAVRGAEYEPGTDTATIGVGGMTCASCVARMERAIKALPGVLDPIANLTTESATVEFLPATVSRARIADADVGIATGTGTVIAVEAGEVILTNGDLICAADGVALTLRIIRLNFFWAYAYNVALVPLTAGAFYPITGWLLNPMLAAGAMSISTRFLVTNSLRRFRPPRPHVSPPEPRDAGQSKSNSPIGDSSHVRVFH